MDPQVGKEPQVNPELKLTPVSQDPADQKVSKARKESLGELV